MSRLLRRLNCVVREAHLALKLDGQRHVIEATARFTNRQEFVKSLEVLGLRVVTGEKRDIPDNSRGRAMPTILRSGPYRFYFYSHETNEPPHVHVDRDDLSAKFWLQPVGLARDFGFSPRELRRLQKLVMQHQAAFLEAWHGHFGADG